MAAQQTIQGIDLFDLWMSFMSYVNTFVSGWFRINTDFVTACNDISNDLWNKWTAEAEKSQEARDNLIFFLTSKNIIVKSQNSYYGIVTPPADYGRYASARMIVGADDQTVPSPLIDGGKCVGLETDQQLAEDYYNKVQEVDLDNIDNQRWGGYVKHLTKGPTMGNPALTQTGISVNGTMTPILQVAPRSVSVIVLS